ncbi:MAG: nucleoside deaminase [Rickettsiales bacterium]
MEESLRLAGLSSDNGEVPVGAVIVRSGTIIASAHNKVEKDNDPTAHAEMLAIRAACEILGTARLNDCDLYVTLEPCAMCAQAISFARIRRLYFGAYDVKGGGVENGARIFAQSTCHHKPEIYGGIDETRCGELLKAFFRDRRE